MHKRSSYLFASHLFLITANLRESHVKTALRFVWTALPIPSTTTRSQSHVHNSSNNEIGRRLKDVQQLMSFYYSPICPGSPTLCIIKERLCSQKLLIILVTIKLCKECKNDENNYSLLYTVCCIFSIYY